jgi:hypothetical protein
MWVTDDGRQHVLALPDPSDVLTGSALASFAQLLAHDDREALALLLDDRLLELSDAGFAPDPDGAFVERAPAEGMLDGDLSTRESLLAALAPIDPRWQVDLLVSLHRLIEQLDDETP